MHEVVLTVTNTAGIHCRPAHFLVMAALRHPNTELHIRRTSTSEEGPFDWTPVGSILGMMALNLRLGERVVVRAVGGDESAALADVEDVLLNDFFAIDFGGDLRRAMDQHPESVDELLELLDRAGAQNIRQWISSPRARTNPAQMKAKLALVLRESSVRMADTPSRDELAELIIARFGT